VVEIVVEEPPPALIHFLVTIHFHGKFCWFDPIGITLGYSPPLNDIVAAFRGIVIRFSEFIVVRRGREDDRHRHFVCFDALFPALLKFIDANELLDFIEAHVVVELNDL